MRLGPQAYLFPHPIILSIPSHLCQHSMIPTREHKQSFDLLPTCTPDILWATPGMLGMKCRCPSEWNPENRLSLYVLAAPYRLCAFFYTLQSWPSLPHHPSLLQTEVPKNVIGTCFLVSITPTNWSLQAVLRRSWPIFVRAHFPFSFGDNRFSAALVCKYICC